MPDVVSLLVGWLLGSVLRDLPPGVQPLELVWFAIAVVGQIVNMIMHHWCSEDRRDLYNAHVNGRYQTQAFTNVWTFRGFFAMHWLCAVGVVPLMTLPPRAEVDPDPTAAIAGGILSLCLIASQAISIAVSFLKWWNRSKQDAYRRAEIDDDRAAARFARERHGRRRSDV